MNTLWLWLSTPLSGAASHHLEPGAYWHARLMVLAWGLVLPAGVLMARYFKVLPAQNWPSALDNKLWWHAHRFLQWGGVVLASLAIYVVTGPHTLSAQLTHGHGIAGWWLMGMAWMQVVSGAMRGSKGGPTSDNTHGDHYDMTPHRIWFERLHKGIGWLSLLTAIGVIASGLVLADAPRWMPLVLALWWAMLLGLAMQWQKQGRCIDTYQAIWGPDPSHPGNQLQPIGWGIRRPIKKHTHG